MFSLFQSAQKRRQCSYSLRGHHLQSVPQRAHISSFAEILVQTPCQR
uniref:GSVIVT01025610001 n=1 Tax=Arundo donax TaxID=35708 RepID=A0A0A9H4M5_ARUDO